MSAITLQHTKKYNIYDRDKSDIIDIALKQVDVGFESATKWVDDKYRQTQFKILSLPSTDAIGMLINQTRLTLNDIDFGTLIETIISTDEGNLTQEDIETMRQKNNNYNHDKEDWQERQKVIDDELQEQIDAIVQDVLEKAREVAVIEVPLPEPVSVTDVSGATAGTAITAIVEQTTIENNVTEKVDDLRNRGLMNDNGNQSFGIDPDTGEWVRVIYDENGEIHSIEIKSGFSSNPEETSGTYVVYNKDENGDPYSVTIVQQGNETTQYSIQNKEGETVVSKVDTVDTEDGKTYSSDLYTYDENGNPQTVHSEGVIDSEGNQTRTVLEGTTYSPNGDTQIVRQEGDTVTIVKRTGGTETSTSTTTDANGNVTSEEIIEINTSTGEKTKTTKTTDPTTGKTTEEHTQQNADGTTTTTYTDSDGNTWNQTTDANGNITRTGTDAEGNSYTYTQDADGNGHYTVVTKDGKTIVDTDIDGDTGGGDSGGDSGGGGDDSGND